MKAHKLTNRRIISKKGNISSCLLSLLITAVMGLMLPSQGFAEEPVFSPTRSQKGVRTSTDVIVFALPATALATTLIERDWEGLKEGALSAAVTAGITIGLKYIVKEQRPDFSNRYSFPSGHSAATFASATYIGRRYGWKWSIPAYALSTYTAWGRVYGRKHHWWDVAVGAAIGAGSTMLFTHPYMRKHEAALVPIATDTSVGMALGFTF